MNCSKCGKYIEEVGEIGGASSPSASVRGAGNASDIKMWRAQVCTKCRLIFCGNCIKPGRPAPCPECGNPTEPALKGNIQAMGKIRTLVKKQSVSSQPSLNSLQEKPSENERDADEIEQFRKLLKSRLKHPSLEDEQKLFFALVIKLAELKAAKETSGEEKRRIDKMMDVVKDEMIESEVSKFKSNLDPLYRANQYRQWLYKDLIEQEEFAYNSIHHILIAQIADNLTLSQLMDLIKEYDSLTHSVPLDELKNRKFTVKRGLFHKPFTITGEMMDMLLPKLRLLVKSPLWKLE